MRRPLIGGLLALVTVCVSFGPGFSEGAATEPQRTEDCDSRGGRTLLANPRTRLYVMRDRLGNRFYRHCWRATGRAQTFRHGGGRRQLVKHLKLAGRFYAYAIEQISDGSSGVGLQVVVRDARKRFSMAGFLAQPPGDHLDTFYVDAVPGVTDVEVTPAGSVAWIAPGHPDDDAYFYVQRADGQAPGQVVLDHGPGIDPTSLAVGHGRLYWTNDGAARSASIRGRARRRR